MLRAASLIALAVASVASAPALAEQVTVSYQGTVTRVDGPHAAAFTVGQPISLQYTLDTSVADHKPEDPSASVFFNGLLGMQVGVPGAGVQATTGSGTVQVFNDVGGPSDQVFIYGSATGGTLAGNPITMVNTNFLDWTVGPDGKPALVSSDAMPTYPLLTNDSFVMLYTGSEYTFVYFDADVPPPTLEELVFDGRALLRDLLDAGQLRSGHASALDSKYADVLAAVAAGNTALACDSVQALRNQIRALENTRQISAATAAELRASANAIGQSLGC